MTRNIIYELENVFKDKLRADFWRRTSVVCQEWHLEQRKMTNGHHMGPHESAHEPNSLEMVVSNYKYMWECTNSHRASAIVDGTLAAHDRDL